MCLIRNTKLSYSKYKNSKDNNNNNNKWLAKWMVQSDNMKQEKDEQAYKQENELEEICCESVAVSISLRSYCHDNLFPFALQLTQCSSYFQAGFTCSLLLFSSSLLLLLLLKMDAIFWRLLVAH